MALYNFFIFLSILTEDGWKLASELTSKDKIKTSSGFIQVLSTKIEHLKEKTNVYNLNVLGYHTYVVGNGLLIAHNSCKKQNIEASSKQEAIDIANSKVGNNQKIVYKNGKEFHVSEDGLRTWRFIVIVTKEDRDKIILM